MRQFEEKKYLHVQRKKYYYILTYNKNVYHVALMSLVCAKIEMMLLVSYLVSVVMLCVKENKYVCGFGFTMRRNLLNWCNLVSISKELRLYVHIWSGKNLLTFC